MVKMVKQNMKKKSDFNFLKVKLFDFQIVVKVCMNKNVINVIGLIVILFVDLYLLIGNGVSNEMLVLVVGMMKVNQKMGQGNYVLVGYYMIKYGVLFSLLYYKSKVG